MPAAILLDTDGKLVGEISDGGVRRRAEDEPRIFMILEPRGKPYDEVAPLRVALAFERATKWHTMHPKLDSGS